MAFTKIVVYIVLLSTVTFANETSANYDFDKMLGDWFIMNYLSPYRVIDSNNNTCLTLSVSKIAENYFNIVQYKGCSTVCVMKSKITINYSNPIKLGPIFSCDFPELPFYYIIHDHENDDELVLYTDSLPAYVILTRSQIVSPSLSEKYDKLLIDDKVCTWWVVDNFALNLDSAKRLDS